MSNRLYTEREWLLTPIRIQYFKQKLESIGYEVDVKGYGEIQITYKGNIIKIFPYTGWWTGKGVGSGRGIHNLIKKLRDNE